MEWQAGIQTSEGYSIMSPEPTSTAATGKHTTNGVPHGYTALTPFIVVDPAHEAVEFYRDVFGATVLSVMPGAPGEMARPPSPMRNSISATASCSSPTRSRDTGW